MGKWFGPDIVALTIPITFASIGFFSMIGRAFIIDPEWSSGMQYYEKPEAEAAGERYQRQYSQFFQTGSMMIFPNKVEVKE